MSGDICFDWPYVPPAQSADVPDDALSAAFLTQTLWQPGQDITISFIDDDAEPWKKAWVEKVVAEYIQPHVDLNLLFGNYGFSADIRITFKNQGVAYSRLGVQSSYIKEEESMNLGFLHNPTSGTFEWNGEVYTFPDGPSGNTNGQVIIHEFGHAIGMIHEHQNPNGGIEWNVEAVLDHYVGKPPMNWTEEEVYVNILNKYSIDQLNASKFDPESVMMYSIPASLTLDGTSTTSNPVPSKLDIRWMGKVYGKKKSNK